MLKRPPRARTAQARLFAGKSRSCFSNHSSVGFTGSWHAGGDAQAAPALFCWGPPRHPRSAPTPRHLHGTGQCPQHLLPQHHTIPKPPRLSPGEPRQQRPALPLFRPLPCCHTGSLSHSLGHFCSIHVPTAVTHTPKPFASTEYQR